MEIFQHHQSRAHMGVGWGRLPQPLFDLLLFDLSRHLFWERWHFRWLHLLALPSFDLGFRFWEGSSNLSCADSAFFRGKSGAGEQAGSLVQSISTDMGDASVL